MKIQLFLSAASILTTLNAVLATPWTVEFPSTSGFSHAPVTLMLLQVNSMFSVWPGDHRVPHSSTGSRGDLVVRQSSLLQPNSPPPVAGLPGGVIQLWLVQRLWPGNHQPSGTAWVMFTVSLSVSTSRYLCVLAGWFALWAGRQRLPGVWCHPLLMGTAPNQPAHPDLQGPPTHPGGS